MFSRRGNDMPVDRPACACRVLVSGSTYVHAGCADDGLEQWKKTPGEPQHKPKLILARAIYVTEYTNQ